MPKTWRGVNKQEPPFSDGKKERKENFVDTVWTIRQLLIKSNNIFPCTQPRCSQGPENVLAILHCTSDTIHIPSTSFLHCVSWFAYLELEAKEESHSYVLSGFCAPDFVSVKVEQVPI